ncbi:hypothetical protein DFQ27_007298, partial [Actinomortierella ambigua]
MRPTGIKTRCSNVPKRDTHTCDKVQKHEPKSLFPEILIKFLKRGFAISRNLLSIGAAPLQEGTKNSTTSQEDGAQSHGAVAYKPATGKETRHSENNVDMELDAGHSAMPVGTCK